MPAPGRHVIALYLFLLFGLIPRTALADQTVVLRDGVDQYLLGQYLEFLEDPASKWQIGDVTSPQLAKGFRKSTSEAPSFGFRTWAHWFRLELHSALKARQRFLLEVAFPMLDRIEIYLQRADGTYFRLEMGDRLPHGGKTIRHCNFLSPLTIEPGQHRRIYLRVQTEGSLQLPATLWTPQGFRDHEHGNRIFYGIYYGLLIVLLLYNLLLFISTRDRSYLFFALFSSSVLAFLSSNDGMAQTYLWPELTWWGNRVIPFAVCSCSLFGALTTIDFLELRRSLPGWHRLLSWVAILALGGALSSFVLPYNTVTRFGTILGAPTALLVWAVSLRSWRGGYRPARYYFIAWTVLLLGVFLLSFSRLGVIPRSPLTESAHVIGFAINIIIISLALTDRINLMQRDKDRARAEALQIQQRAAATLEHEVAIKTRDLRAKTDEVAEAYAKLSEHDRLKSNFFANVSHELRTPLTLILTPLERLLDGEMGELTHAARERLRSMVGNAQRLLRLVNQLLEFSRLESGGTNLSFATADILEVVWPIVKAFEPFARSKGIQLELRASERLPGVITDPVQLEKVISNLLSNACKFTEPGGKVVVRMDIDDAELAISVKDTGIGISAKDLPRIFERFHQVDDGASRRYEGTGIGLALSKELVELIGGRLTVESEVGLFSMFTVHLPLGEEHVPDPSLIRTEIPRDQGSTRATAEVSALEAERGSGDRGAPVPTEGEAGADRPLLVVVEDNPDMRALVSEICADDFRVLGTANGLQALEMIQRERPALVVSDVMLPGMDGTELLERIRSAPETATIPVILMTAKAGEEIRLDGLERGADDYLVKPFEARELRARALNLVRLQRQERELRRLNTELDQMVISQTSRLNRARALETFLPPDVVQEVMQREGPLEQFQRLNLTVFRLELRGFDDVVASVDPEDLTVILNGYLSEMMDVAFEHGATVDMFVMDTVMGFFGAPRSQGGAQQDAVRCTRMAQQMWQRAVAVCSRWRELLEIRPPVPTMALASGYATVGFFGSSQRMGYTALGGAVLEAREVLRQISAGEIVCSHGTWNLIRQEIDAQVSGELSVGPRQRPMRLYRIAGPPDSYLADSIPEAGFKQRPPAVAGDKATVPGLFPLEAGTQVAGRYQILRGLGQGGMGTVYQAWDMKLGTDVALKAVKHPLRIDQSFLERLYGEVRLARLISHSNVARIFDIVGWKGQEFICMECIRGMTLAQRLATAGKLSQAEGQRILIELCNGLAAAHAALIVHGDFKPSNIMLEDQGRVVILDFGIARWMAMLREQDTASRAKLFGTPHYMAPEQFQGQPVDQRADIYALGLVAFEMFTGSRPFSADNIVALAYQHVRVRPPDPLALCPDLHPRMAAVILRCLEKSPDRRFGSIIEVRSLIRDVVL